MVNDLRSLSEQRGSPRGLSQDERKHDLAPLCGVLRDTVATTVNALIEDGFSASLLADGNARSAIVSNNTLG